MRALHLYLFIFFVFVFHSNVNAINAKKNSPDEVIDEVAIAIKSGNSGRLAAFFSSTIDLLLPDNEGTYSKTQAELIIKDFFSKYPPSNFIIKQRGSSSEGSKFAIGIYQCTKGKSFRTYFLLKKSNNNYFITLLEFDSD